MGILDAVLARRSEKKQADYVELDDEHVKGAAREAQFSVRLADVTGQQDIMNIRDALAEGDVVVANMSDAQRYERLEERLQHTAEEVNGDIVRYGAIDSIIITPDGVDISRDKLS